MGFPQIRMRDRRRDEATRGAFRQTPLLSSADFIMPLFVKEGILERKAIRSMPGIHQWPLRKAAREARRIYDAGIPAIILFGIPGRKDETGSSAYDEDGIVQQAIAAIKKIVPDLCVIADVCMCEYTSHGHCGVIKSQVTGHRSSFDFARDSLRSQAMKKKKDYIVDNDETIKVLAKIALSYAGAGVDMVAPSAMMDGEVLAIKEALGHSGHDRVKILAYSAKYASGFYGPFRDAAESPPQFGDRKTYQMDYHNSDEAVLEARLDMEEGADMLMVKPALGYEDIIYRIKRELNFPLACYSVSGEYAMIKAAAQAGYLDERQVVLEALTGLKRAGADRIITYYAKEAAGWIKNKKQT